MEITRAGPEHEPQILDLATRTLGWSDDPRFAELYRWKHDDNAFGPSPRWVAVEDDRVVGFRVMMRWRFRAPDDSVHTAVRAVDTATDPDHQGKGIFRALTMRAVEELTDEGVGFVFNTPNDQSRPGYLKMGWVELGRPPVAVAARLRSVARVAQSRTAAELWSQTCSLGRPAPAALAEDEVVALLADRPLGRWSTDLDGVVLRWRFGLDALGYRVLTDADLSGRRRRSRPTAAVAFRLRRRGASVEATVGAASPPSSARRALLREILRRSPADYVLLAADARVDATPAVALPALSPLVTWRALTLTEPPPLERMAFSLGDLELF